mmetsp:Transcript_78660/g.255368  ORF Transcript_78660/g.255368 Transcript_78660/m.255368 type:complete len:94 (-) Transcript_78660:192-473(-)
MGQSFCGQQGHIVTGVADEREDECAALPESGPLTRELGPTRPRAQGALPTLMASRPCGGAGDGKKSDAPALGLSKQQGPYREERSFGPLGRGQ